MDERDRGDNRNSPWLEGVQSEDGSEDGDEDEGSPGMEGTRGLGSPRVRLVRPGDAS